MAKKSPSVPKNARPMSSGALQSPSRPPPYSGLIDYDDPNRNLYGVSLCPNCGSKGRYPLAKTLEIHCTRCDFVEQGYKVSTHLPAN